MEPLTLATILVCGCALYFILRIVLAFPYSNKKIMYVVHKGDHFFKIQRKWFLKKVNIFVHTSNCIQFISVFNVDCRYNLKSLDQFDLNKLYGFSINGRIHKNSARFAWRYSQEKDRIEIFAYWYNDGKVQYKHMLDVVFNYPVYCCIEKQKTEYIFIVEQFSIRSRETFITKHAIKTEWFKLKSFPYFGGTTAAPHTMSITIKELKS